MRNTIKLEQPEATDESRINTATENAFLELVNRSIILGLPVTRPMGLMYLPDMELTRRFQDACRAIIAALTPTK